MIRTKAPAKPTINANQMQRIQAMQNVILQGGLIGRSTMMSGLGLQYGGTRDVYQALGYITDLKYKDYVQRYYRQDMAKAIINRPVDATWRGDIEILETDDEEETGLEKAWSDLCKKLPLKSGFVRLDKLASLGRWGVLMMGFDDANSKDSLVNPVPKGKHKLLYVKPLSEASAKINTWDTNPSSARYGLPLIYDVTTTSPDGGITEQIRVHYTRTIHVPGELMESEIEGTPALQAVFNRLMDLEKITGGSPEMFWRGARPGYHGKIAEGYQLTETAKIDLQAQIDEYENNLRRILINEGLELTPLAMQVASPVDHVEIQLQMISAATGIPKRILVGSERGELASSEDRMAWLEIIQSRRQDYAETQILRPFVDKCIEYGVLPKAIEEGYKFVWSDIFAPSELDRAKIGQTRAAALMSYMNNPAAELVIPPQIFVEYMLGLEEHDIQHVIKMLEKLKGQVLEDMADVRDVLAVQPPGGGGRQPSIGPGPSGGRPPAGGNAQ